MMDSDEAWKPICDGQGRARHRRGWSESPRCHVRANVLTGVMRSGRAVHVSTDTLGDSEEV